jgi:hypothetical protein
LRSSKTNAFNGEEGTGKWIKVYGVRNIII